MREKLLRVQTTSILSPTSLNGEREMKSQFRDSTLSSSALCSTKDGGEKFV